MVEYFRFVRGSVGDKSFIEDIKNVLVDFFEFVFNFGMVFVNGRDMFVRVFGFFFLFD